jgi:hypothetical protein
MLTITTRRLSCLAVIALLASTGLASLALAEGNPPPSAPPDVVHEPQPMED